MRNTIKLLLNLFIYQSVCHITKRNVKRDLSKFEIEESNVNKDMTEFPDMKINKNMGELPDVRINKDIDGSPELRIIETYKKYPEDKDGFVQKIEIKDIKKN